MSASPSANAVPSTKRPLDEESSPSGPTDQPDAKRPALDKVVKAEDEEDKAKSESAETAPIPVIDQDIKTETDTKPLANGHVDAHGDIVVPDAPNKDTKTRLVGSTCVLSSPVRKQQLLLARAERTSLKFDVFRVQNVPSVTIPVAP